MKIRLKIADGSRRKKSSKIFQEENRKWRSFIFGVNVKPADDIKENETRGKAVVVVVVSRFNKRTKFRGNEKLSFNDLPLSVSRT